jgi:rhodanese-related sulfurtransferase
MQPAELPLEVGVEDTHNLLENTGGAKPRLVDCREVDEWQICHIDGAELVPLSQIGVVAQQLFTHTEEHIIVYCHHGMRSQRAALMLRQLGLFRAQSMRGGIEAWADLIQPDMARY